MKVNNIVISFFALLCLLGCSKTDGSASGGGGTPTAGIEGTYVDPNDPSLSLIIKGGHYQQGGSDIHLEGNYTARKINGTNYELDIVYTPEFGGTKETVLIRKE